MAFRTNKTPVLQEKSASGSVATFNTALAMPLASCNIAVNAWQEGSGDPSPDNVRPIHGFSEVNVTRAGKNIKPNRGNNTSDVITITYNEDDDTYTLNGTATSGNYVLCNIPNSELLWKINTPYVLSVRVLSGNWELGEGTGSLTFAIGLFNSTDTKYIRGSVVNTNPLNLDGYEAKGNAFESTGNYKIYFQLWRYRTIFNNLKIKIQIEAGDAATAYEPYVTPTIYTKALGETVYGGSYNIDGTKRKTYAKYIFDGSVEPDAVNWRPQANSIGCYWLSFTDFKPSSSIMTPFNCISDKLKTVSYQEIYGNDIFSIAASYSSQRDMYYLFMRFKDTSLTTRQAVCDYLARNPITVVYETKNHIESNIGATPISTNIGNNNIFCDTGDTSLVYKDLDIAKRGNFREVFRLPS